MKKAISFTLFLSFLLTSVSVYADFRYDDYDWEADPALTELTPEEAEFSAVTITEQHILEYVYDDNDELISYKTIHERIRLNDNTAVEYYNKMYIPMYRVDELVSVKARSIATDGSVTYIEEDDVKFIENFEDLGPYSIFAFEGVEVGGEIEYIYTQKMKIPSYFGKLVFQSELPVKHAGIELYAPENLLFEVKAYNGFTGPERDTTNDEQNVYTASMTDIPPLYPENYALYDGHRMRVEYRMAFNLSSFATLFSWDDAALRYSSILYERDKTTEKEIAKLIKKNRSEPAGNERGENQSS